MAVGGTMHKGFFIDVMQRKPALFAAMLAFNGMGPRACGAETAVPGSSACALAADIPGIDMAALLATPAARRRLLADTDEASSKTFWDFAEESRRLVLVEPEVLRKLLLAFGAALHAPEYAHCVLRDEVLALRSALGDELYRYGLLRGRYQIGSVRQYFGPVREDEQMTSRIEGDGWTALGLCASAWPESLRERAEAVFGRPVFPVSDVSPAAVRGVWFALKKLLLREVAPQWAPCFD